MHQAGVQTSGLSSETSNVVEADAVMLVEGEMRVSAMAS